MITGTEIYWLTRLKALDGFLFIICMLTCSGSVICILEKKKKLTKILISVFVVALFLDIFLPSQKEIAAIYLLPKIVNSKDVSEIPPNAAKLFNSKLKQWMNEEIGVANEKNKTK